MSYYQIASSGQVSECHFSGDLTVQFRVEFMEYFADGKWATFFASVLHLLPPFVSAQNCPIKVM